MRRWLAGSFIAIYLSALGYGLLCHTLSFNLTSHPMMYFVVWDMFCGWSAYASHLHVVAEGESGKFYQVVPPPWGEMKPYGDIGRQHYDSFLMHAPAQAKNVLRHTKHEPITRMFVVESAWAKKYDIPDHVWNQNYPEAKDPHTYYRLRLELCNAGDILRRYNSWLDNYSQLVVMDNPRLAAEARAAQSFFVVDHRGQGAGYLTHGSSRVNSAPKGN